MNDKQLVDALVQDGLLAFEPARGLRSYYWLLLGADEFVRFDTEHEIVNDWRVAGACMERITEDTFTWFFFESKSVWVVVENAFEGREWADASLPRVIIEAYVQAVETSDG